ncbi:hypothetical protein BDZ45DRAFT_603270 [Acephala macrosclerotiorum]|nr:hypothetical protein BDZ45DRAFT_603270 [Acephala macrosclerotiorum]
MSITIDANGQPLVTSLYDWETGCIMPAILSDPLMAVTVDLVIDENAAPSFIRVRNDATPDDRAQYVIWAKEYFIVHPSFSIVFLTPNYERIIQAGKDARHLWFALREWRADDPEGYFGNLGAWAERRVKELGIDSAVPQILYDN